MHIDVSTAIFIAGVAILSTTLILSTRLRYQREAKRAAERRAAAQAAKETERKRQAALAEPSKVRLASGNHTAPDRIALGTPHDPTFSAGVTPRSIAKWETEIHQIGRQMIGQLDSKSVVLQTLTREANRTANRLEILIDHLETLLKNVATSQKPTMSDGAEQSYRIPREAVTQTVEAFTDVLKELENEIDQFHEPVEEPIPSVTVLKAEDLVVPTNTEKPSTPAVSTPTVSTLSHATHRITVQPGAMEFSTVSSFPIPSPLASDRQPGLSVTSLFDDNLVKRHEEPEWPLHHPSVPVYQTPLIEQSALPKLISEAAPFDKRRQVAMLTDYGYTPKQIAQDLDLTVGEVELMLSLRN